MSINRWSLRCLAVGLLSLTTIPAMAQNAQDIVGRWVFSQTQGGMYAQERITFDNRGRYRYELLGHNQLGAVAKVCIGIYNYNGETINARPQQCQACGSGNCVPIQAEGQARFTVHWIDNNSWSDGITQYHRG